MKSNLKFNVTTESTLLPFLLTCFDNKSRNYVKGILSRGQVLVDGGRCTDYARPLLPGQQIMVLHRAPALSAKPDIPIIYEDDDMIVIDKPAGMLSISTDQEHTNTAYYIMNDYMKSIAKSGRIFIVHRLDRETSGVMLLAKNERTKYALQERWEELTLRRGYTAVVEGKVSPFEGKITSWLKQTKTLLMYSSKEKGQGKLAITKYCTLQSTDRHSLLDISLETGRKNQIRVHMKDIEHPIVGDKKYGALTNPIDRICLHASVLRIKHPFTGEELCFESSVPSAFMKVMSGR
ncbi:MAG: RluA family pseudouridine synthase [Oscillospiraceae bacterium]|nr:RluA family pseudouridine synthase [Oscillospiraceae bacterium]